MFLFFLQRSSICFNELASINGVMDGEDGSHSHSMWVRTGEKGKRGRLIFPNVRTCNCSSACEREQLQRGKVDLSMCDS